MLSPLWYLSVQKACGGHGRAGGVQGQTSEKPLRAEASEESTADLLTHFNTTSSGRAKEGGQARAWCAVWWPVALCGFS